VNACSFIREDNVPKIVRLSNEVLTALVNAVVLPQPQATPPPRSDVQATVAPTTRKGERLYPANWHKIVRSSSRFDGVTRGGGLVRSAQAQVKILTENLPSPQKNLASQLRQHQLDEVAAIAAVQARCAVSVKAVY
jgi:hypothetical protein